MKKIFKRGVLLLMGLALLVACGPSPSSTPTPNTIPTDPAPAATEPPAPTAAPIATNTPEPAPTAAPSTNTNANCTNRAGNVRDATVPDDTVFKPGATFIKTWRIKNVGTCTWGAGYTVIFSVGDNMQIAPQNAKGSALSASIPATPPGADAEVSVNLQASFKVGKYKGFWLLRGPDGKTFGTGSDGNIPFWVQVVVKR